MHDPDLHEIGSEYKKFPYQRIFIVNRIKFIPQSVEIMSIIEDLDEELSLKIERLQDGLNNLGELQGQKRTQELKRLSALHKSASDEYKGYSFELLELNRAQYEDYFEKGKQYKEQLEFIKNSIAAAKASENGEKPTYDGMMKEMFDTQEDDKKRVKGMITTVKNIEETGVNVLTDLKQQSEALNRADKAMDQLDDEIALARKELRKFIVGLARDKCLRVLMILTIVGIVACVGVYLGLKYARSS